VGASGNSKWALASKTRKHSTGNLEGVTVLNMTSPMHPADGWSGAASFPSPGRYYSVFHSYEEAQ
jgi:hypothetical protein